MSAELPNFKKMFALIEEVFATRNNPDQIQVTPNQLKKLQKLHPSTLSEFADKNGPLIWVLVFPTSKLLMEQFLTGAISEKAMLDKTKIGASFDCIYLCSVTTLPEVRGKGKTKQMCIAAIQSICAVHPIKTLFVWPFTKEGDALAESVAQACKLELQKIRNKK